MFKLITCLTLAAVFFVGLGKVEGEEYPILTQQESAQFQTKMIQAIELAEQNVKELQSKATSPNNAPTWNSKLELQNAVIQLEVKKTLLNNFKNTESLRSALVRQKLLDVLNKPTITTSDLADLQSLVLEEKAKIRARSATAAQHPSTETLMQSTPQPQSTDQLLQGVPQQQAPEDLVPSTTPQ